MRTILFIRFGLCFCKTHPTVQTLSHLYACKLIMFMAMTLMYLVWFSSVMDGIVALCHFCELHGPAVLMCTQPHRQPSQQKTSGSQGQQEAQQLSRKISSTLSPSSGLSLVPGTGNCPTTDISTGSAGRYCKLRLIHGKLGLTPEHIFIAIHIFVCIPSHRWVETQALIVKP